MSFFAELKRRNVFRVGIAYVVGGWLLLQLTDVLSELLDLPDVVGRAIVLLITIGLPVALFFAWAFEMTPEGVKREKDVDRSQSITKVTGQKLNNFIIGVLVVALTYFAIDKFILAPGRAQPGSDPFSQQVGKQTAENEEKKALTPVEVEATPSSIEAHKAPHSLHKLAHRGCERMDAVLDAISLPELVGQAEQAIGWQLDEPSHQAGQPRPFHCQGEQLVEVLDLALFLRCRETQDRPLPG